jgi:mono/diheme cytochrome c family protein
MRLPVVFLMISCLATLADERVPRPVATTGGGVVNFSLLDYKGKYHELRRTDARAIVLFFTSFGCPIARQSIPKLRSLRSQFATNGVVLWLVNSSPQEDPDDAVVEMLVRSRGNGVVPEAALSDPDALRSEVLKSAVGSLPVLRDELQLVAQRLGVTRTCEAIAIDPKTMTIIFRGGIDDQFTEGAQKPKATQKYLATALTEFLAGKPVTSPQAPVHGCLISFESQRPDPATAPVSYPNRIAPLLQKHCVGCHSPGNIGPFSMSSYQKVKGWSAMMEEVVLDRRMPPWHADPHYGKFANNRAMDPADTRALLDWIQQGCPRGEGADPLTNAPPPAVHWTLGTPDFVVSLPKPQQIPATGTLNYRYVDSDFEMPQDGWLRAAVCRAGNAKVVHHIIVRVRYPEDYKEAPKEAYLFTSWVPGLQAREFPAGTGMFLPKGTRFNFELHYTTSGQAQTDQSEMGLYLAKQPAQRRLEVRASDMRDFELAPGDPDAQHFSHYCFKRDAVIYDLSPHMHLRGSWFKFQLLYPDGRRETLLSVPQYDFNWQTSYRLAEPKRVPAGTWMLCTGGHDNSAKNPNNPDPSKRVKWGLQSWDEMFMGFMTVADAPAGTAAK